MVTNDKPFVEWLEALGFRHTRAYRGVNCYTSPTLGEIEHDTTRRAITFRAYSKTPLHKQAYNLRAGKCRNCSGKQVSIHRSGYGLTDQDLKNFVKRYKM